MTAVELFFNELQRMQYFIGNDMLQAYKQAKQMEKQMVIDIVEKSRATGLTAEYLLLTYGSKGSDETKTDNI